jgi:hypothetical protein
VKKVDGMPLLSKSELNRLVGQEYQSVKFSKSLEKAVTDEIDHKKTYDVFLSHSYLDRETVFKLNYLLEERLGLDVFVDWIENPDLDRSQVTPETAAQLRGVMDRCKTLVYAISANSAGSKWMPWELGYSDARHGRVAVLPISDYQSTTAAYMNQEFLGLYPYIDIDDSVNGNRYLWIKDPQNRHKYALFHFWPYGVDLKVHSP